MTADDLQHWMTRLAMAGAIFYAGWICSAAYFNIAHHWQESKQLAVVQTKVLPKVQTQLKQANCDKRRLVGVAVDALDAANGFAVAAPDYSDIRGCAPVVPVRPQTSKE